MSNAKYYKQRTEARRHGVARELNRWMDENGQNQTGLSKLSGVPRDQICRYCNAESFPGPRYRDRLAKAMGITPGEFMKACVGGSADGSTIDLEIRQTVSLEQASQIMQILGEHSVQA